MTEESRKSDNPNFGFRESMKHKNSERGAIIVLMVLMLTVLALCLNVLVQVAVMMKEKIIVQTAADAGALAGMSMFARGQNSANIMIRYAGIRLGNYLRSGIADFVMKDPFGSTLSNVIRTAPKCSKLENEYLDEGYRALSQPFIDLYGETDIGFGWETYVGAEVFAEEYVKANLVANGISEGRILKLEVIEWLSRSMAAEALFGDPPGSLRMGHVWDNDMVDLCYDIPDFFDSIQQQFDEILAMLELPPEYWGENTPADLLALWNDMMDDVYKHNALVLGCVPEIQTLARKHPPLVNFN